MFNKLLQLLLFTTLLLCFLFINTTFSADFVGAEQCKTCHKEEYNAWQGSHHDMSMKHANSVSVLGDFNNITFISNEQKNKFYKKDKQFWVNIKGDDGKFQDFQIKYTFGYEPLQQYMVEFDDGRVQLIPFAWDSRTKMEGGQRWFNLYPEMIESHQGFFWTNTGQNWNYMCADCHSTNVSKNFDQKTNSYNTTFSEINVACESCHGPGSKHIAWSKDKTIKEFGFERTLSSSVKGWIPNKDTPNTLSPMKIEESQQVLVCAQCHSRRTQISNNNHINKNAFGERYLLDLVSSTNYHPDGQVYNENFVYGSFLQSKMYKKGVVCSDCHNPHTAELKLPIESLCLQCHQADNYANKKHHQHKIDSAGAQCVNCHMPETTYMEVDARRDHGFHIPTPNLANQLGTPDTCLTCHENKDSQWSASKINTWYPNSKVKDQKDFVPVFSAINMSLSQQQLNGVANELSRIAQTISYAGIIRASALSKMASVSNTNTIIAIARAVKSTDENIRLGAIEGSQNMASAEKWRILSPLLNDNVLIVRANAAFALAGLWNNLTDAQRKQLSSSLNEYIEIQKFNSDRAFSHANIAIVFAYKGEYKKAIDAFNEGIRIENYYPSIYINLSQVYRQLNDNHSTIKTLKEGIITNPNDAELPFNLALAYIRNKDKQRASKYLIKATQLAPQNSHYWYVLGLSTEKQSKQDSYKALNAAYKISRNPQHLYALCEMQVRHQAFAARDCLKRLTKVVPTDVVKQLSAQMK